MRGYKNIFAGNVGWWPPEVVPGPKSENEKTGYTATKLAIGWTGTVMKEANPLFELWCRMFLKSALHQIDPLRVVF